MPRPHLFSPAGEAALAEVTRRQPLLAFDFDGTLAPIVARSGDARVSPAVAERLARLSRLRPVAIVTGRSIDDVRKRLGFEPRYIVGSHGAEDHHDPQAAQTHRLTLDGLRAVLDLHRAGLEAVGVQVEDKGQSVALHYRQARERRLALSALDELLAGPDPSLRVFPGKMVLNVVPASAPDKAGAVMALVARSEADCAVFVGDDVNDEPVFVSAPPEWLTVRVGRDEPCSRARFFLDSTREVAMLLERLLVHLGHSGTGPAVR